MFNSYVQEQRALAATREQASHTDKANSKRTELALKYKQRLDQELVKVLLLHLVELSYS